MYEKLGICDVVC